MAVVLASLVVLPTTASAEPNSAIEVSGVTITSQDGGQATVGDTLTVSGSWDATEADPQAGDTFTIGLPSELGFGESISFQLSGDGQVWANCLTDAITGVATCTLTDAVAENPELVHGTFEFEVEAITATDAEAVDFNLNGDTVSVDLPGEGGIDDGIVLPDDWSKSGQMNANNWSMSWTIELPGARMADHDVITIAETLSGNHQLCQPSNVKVQTVRGDTVVDVTDIIDVVPGADPQHFSYQLTAPAGGFDPAVTYRITYDTCTPDGQIDPPDTEYTNEASIDVWGESSGVIGVDNRPWFSGDVNKSGTVLGGGDRNGKVEWTVEVSGDYLSPRDGFTLTEQLTGEHRVCEDGSTINDLRVIERYGPSSQADRNVTDEFDVTPSSTENSFEAELTIADGSSFAFKPSDYRYLIVYTTCVTTEGLPEQGTDFGNQANVDGAIDGSIATVPGRNEGKSGRINTSTVTLDGAQYLPQTTLGWTITVPGETLADADIEGDLTITDTLSASQAVCGLGDDIPARLGLVVRAVDQIQGGGLGTVTLPGVTATLSGDDIRITIPEPDLPVPGGGGTTATGFSREYQYVISYTTCTTSGGMDAPGTVYSNAAAGEGFSYSQRVTQNNSGSGTGQGVSRGSVAIQKLVDGAGAAFVPAGTTFSVHVQEIAPDGTVVVEYDRDLPLGGDPVSGPNSRGTGWTVRLSEPTFPTIPGVTFGTPVFTESDGVTVNSDGSATAALTPGSNIAVELTNTAQLGSLEIEKVLEGPAAGQVDPDQEYAITAQIDTSALGADFPAQPDREFTVEAGEPYTLTDLPIGATVSFSETVPEDDDTFTWSAAQIAPGSIEVLPAHVNDPATITVTNTVERTVGTFSLVKLVTGEQADNPAVPDEVTVTATWDEEGTPGSDTLTLPTDGTPVPFGHDLLVGTEVTLTETSLEDGSSIAWGAPTWTGEGVTLDGTSAVVTIGRNAQATVTLENHAATSTAGISLLKGVAGEAAGEVDPGTEFPVTATWTDADGVDQSRDLTINAAAPTSLGEDLPAGTVVTITEGERPGIDTVVWDQIVISGDGVEDAGDGSATVVVSDQQNAATLVTVVNEATWAPGTLSVTKSVTGVQLGNPDVPQTVTVTAAWTDADGVDQTTELTVPTDGTAVPLGIDLPHGTDVTLSESPLEDSAAFTWDAPAWTGDATVGDDGTAVATIGAATVAEVTLTNNATVSSGSLELIKTVAGEGAGDVAEGTTFPVTLSWTDLLGEPQHREVEIGVGEPTTVDGLPLGTEIRVVEGEVELADTVSWAGVQWSSADAAVTITAQEDPVALVTITGADGTQAQLTIENAFDAVADGTGLPVSGADGLLLVGAGLLAALLIAGGVTITNRARRTR